MLDYRTFIFAAMDTTSSALARILHILAEQPQRQEKLREEVINASQGDLSHEELHALPYLNAVCKETLRL
jgi:cytochrome P450